ncbi:MAG: sigma-70 family RNA polymerase sigma factor [Solirubrobacterales bacterium]
MLKRFSTQADAEAFAELMRRYVRLVYSTSWRVLKNEGDAADVTQETFFELTRCAGRVSGPLSSWLHQIATRKAIDLVRRSIHRRRREQAYSRTRPEVAHTWHDLSGHVDEALDKLDAPTRAALLEHFLAGKTMSEIARDQGVSQATISRRINDGLERLRGALRRQGLLVATSALGVMLLENASQAVPMAVLGELNKMAMVGAAGAAATLGGKAAVAVHAGAVKALFGAAAVVAVVSAAGYIHHCRQTRPPTVSSISKWTLRQPTQPNRGGRSYSTDRKSVAGAAQSEVDSPADTGSSRAESSRMEELLPMPSEETLSSPEPIGGMSVGDPFSDLPTVDLTTPEAVVHSFLALIDQGATDQLSECFAEGHEAATDDSYPRYLGRPARLVEVTAEGDTARVLWEAQVHTPFTHKGHSCSIGEFVPLCSRLVRMDGSWRLLRLDE